VRSRWHRTSRQPPPPLLRAALLASYTIDPLVPYLGMALHDAGLPTSLWVGRYHQIMQQCLDDTGQTARQRPDLLVVAPRFEDLGSGPETAGELASFADAALAAGHRWRCCLVFVLPAIPAARPCGAGDAGAADGVVATATAIREELRAQLVGQPNVCVADAEEAVRAVGADHAHHPVLYRLAKVPYTEEFFARLAAQLVGLLRARYGLACRVVVLDADRLFGFGAAALREPLRELHQAGIRLTLRGSRDLRDGWASVATEFPELLRDLLDGWSLDDRPPAEQVRALAAEAGVPTEQAALLTTDRALASDRDTAVVLLSEAPERWPAELRAAGVFDQLPEVQAGDPARSRPDRPERRPGPVPLSVAEFVAGLGVRLSFQPAEPTEVAELVARAKDFTLGTRTTPEAVARLGGTVVAVSVRDRYGDYGVSGAVALRLEPTECKVDLFAVSCPVLGKGVEEGVLREVVARADQAGCDRVLVRYRETGRNAAAVRFLAACAGRAWPAPSGRELPVVSESEPSR
jgi:FkbH-like protein